MADNNSTPASPNLETRVAVLEQIVRDIATALADIRADIREMRARQHTDFLWMLSLQLGGFAALLGVVAHGFHWI